MFITGSSTVSQLLDSQPQWCSPGKGWGLNLHCDLTEEGRLSEYYYDPFDPIEINRTWLTLLKMLQKELTRWVFMSSTLSAWIFQSCKTNFACSKFLIRRALQSEIPLVQVPAPALLPSWDPEPAGSWCAKRCKAASKVSCDDGPMAPMAPALWSHARRMV